MEVKLFVRDDCPNCPAAMRACEGIAALSVYDIGELDGLAEASSWGVHVAPSVLVVDSAGNEIAAWRGEAPDATQLHAVLAN